MYTLHTNILFRHKIPILGKPNLLSGNETNISSILFLILFIYVKFCIEAKYFSFSTNKEIVSQR
jgi:hypothetical protein